MDDHVNDSEKQTPYIREKIRKKRFSPARFFMQVVLCLLLAVIFGAAASVVFVVVQPWAQRLAPEEESSSLSTLELSTYPSYEEPVATDERQTDPEAPEEEESSIDENELSFNDVQRQWIRELIEDMLERDSADLSDLDAVDEELNSVYEKVRTGMAVVSGYGSDDDEANQVIWQTNGAVFYENQEANEILILAETSNVTDTSNVKVLMEALPDISLDATVKGWDHVFGIAVFSVSTTSLSRDEISSINIIEIGNSYQVSECDTVMAVGTPYGVQNSVAVGRVTCVLPDQTTLDSIYRMFYTDMELEENAGGFLINTAGELVGLLLPGFKDASLSCCVAVGTEELKGTLNSMMNGRTVGLLGVYGMDVTEELEASGMPQGVYVSNVQVNGPAYNAGISAGDIITGISTQTITSMSDLTSCMVEAHLPEETVIVYVMRMSPDGYKPMEISVTLGAR